MVCFHTLKALIYLHSRNIIHRDVKAANILLNDQAQVKIGTAHCGLSAAGRGNIHYSVHRANPSFGVTVISAADFGVSEQFSGHGAESRTSDKVLGTPLWMAPGTMRLATPQCKIITQRKKLTHLNT